MSSILTNNSAMIALQTLNTINKNLTTVSKEISTGFKVGSAKDNAAVFAISQVMRSDVKGFEAISESLSLGQSTVAVASDAAKGIGDLLLDIKKKIVTAGENNVDRAKIQDEVASLVNQVSSIASAAQFNGLNLLNNGKVVADGAAVTTANIVANKGSQANSVLASLDRGSDQTVSTASITVNKQDLTNRAGAAGTGTDLAAAAFTVSGAAAAALGSTATLTVVGDVATAARGGNRVLAGDSYTIGGLTGVTGAVRYVARDGDSVNDIAAGIAERINLQAAADGIKLTASVSGAAITLTNNTGAAVTATSTLTTGGTTSGGLETLSLIDVSTEEGATAALSAIEGLIQTTTNAQAALGTSESRIEIQNEFMGALIDSFKSGIGSLVDANMEEAAARLQALQVQQQLGTQALSIANQAPQSILALFR
ncbi:MAG: flagellin [Pikeienuella sp.]|uniref:flagellin N-terminal helical domain-containing protein n=1 Tax=Pikeienuella sp. TaxID=2831957 RepID=UPI00391BE9C8